MSKNLYENYTSTASLESVVNEKAMLDWSRGYFMAHYKKLLPSDKHAKVLEVGCGYGRYIKILSEMGYTDCYGVDLSSEQIAYAKTKLSLENVEQANALDWLVGKDQTYDCILGLDLLEHLNMEDLLTLGERIYKALKPGGIIILQVPNGMSPLNPIIYGDLTHVRAFTVRSMQQFLLLVGFGKKSYFEIPPYVHGIRSAIQRAIWSSFFRPLIGAFVYAVHGKVLAGNIYSSNFIAYAVKNN
jgi:2-polyprenyl-3-methyl-5-hydroxy-6-metoxy-1,4-benzoquinol methylase